MQIIASPVDFIGTNIYATHHFVQASDSEEGYEFVPYQETHPRAQYPGTTTSIPFSPESMYWGTRFLVDVWGAKEIFITENGLPTSAETDAEGNDLERVVWLRAYLTQLQRATAEGVPVHGYFHWSTMDNFEWAAGYGPKFGLYRVDFETQERTPKLSAKWYKEVAARNAVV